MRRWLNSDFGAGVYLLLGNSLISAGGEAFVPRSACADLTSRSLRLLIPWLEPPTMGCRDDGAIDSLLLGDRLVDELRFLLPLEHLGPTELVFRILDLVLENRITVDEITALQVTRDERSSLRRHNSDIEEDRAIDIVMPHRGDSEHLRAALFSIANAKNSSVKLSLGFDGDRPEIAKQLSIEVNCRQFTFSPAPVGPYVIRDTLIRSSSSGWIAFHDSDDISCSNRFAILSTCCGESDFVGSHEVQVRYDSQSVAAIRFPLDVKRSVELNPEQAHVLLFPTSIIRREAYMCSGGFSTDLRFASLVSKLAQRSDG
jgi:hypothetical protein